MGCKEQSLHRYHDILKEILIKADFFFRIQFSLYRRFHVRILESSTVWCFCIRWEGSRSVTELYAAGFGLGSEVQVLEVCSLLLSTACGAWTNRAASCLARCPVWLPIWGEQPLLVCACVKCHDLVWRAQKSPLCIFEELLFRAVYAAVNLIKKTLWQTRMVGWMM